jgi:hypothetical protein
MMPLLPDDEGAHVAAITAAVVNDFPDDMAAIGGLAASVHASRRPVLAPLVWTTHVADVMVSRAAYADVRDLYEVTPNRRLDKCQFITDRVEFDIYVEHQSRLRVPVPVVLAYAVPGPPFPVACAEHLLILKSEAAVAGFASSNGAKDRADLLLLLVCNPAHADRLHPFLTAAHRDVLNRVDHATALDLTRGNAHLATQLISDASTTRTALWNALPSFTALPPRGTAASSQPGRGRGTGRRTE